MPQTVIFNSRIPQAKLATSEAIFKATVDMFAEVKAEAIERSPVTPEGLAHNIAKHRKDPEGTGENRQSIDVTVTQFDHGTKGKLFTESGHGGFLEVGTHHMHAQPYLRPAFHAHVGELGTMLPSRLQETTRDDAALSAPWGGVFNK